MGEMRAALLCLLLPFAAQACTCQTALPACKEVAAADLVFAGTVVSIQPSFLDSWNAGQRTALDLLNQESARAQARPSPAAFARLRDAYFRVFPDLPEEHKKRLAAATSPEDLSTLFYWILDHGKRVRLRVKTVYRGELDDDDDAPETMAEVWTAFGDCGVSFQTGETYLVYAADDEETGILTTSSCTHTRRISDAGDDLAYLYFYTNFADSAGRVDGFVTSDPFYLRTLDPNQYTGRIGSPVPAVVELKANGTARYTEPDSNGHFVFDGLPAGAFTLNAWAPGYPAQAVRLAGPTDVKLEDLACTTKVLVAIPKSAP